MENSYSDDYRLRIRKASEALAFAQYQEALARIAQMFAMPDLRSSRPEASLAKIGDNLCSSRPEASLAKIEITQPPITKSPSK